MSRLKVWNGTAWEYADAQGPPGPGLPEDGLILVDVNHFTPRISVTLTSAYPQLIPMSKISGGLSIASDIITLEKGYLYEVVVDLYISNASGYGIFKVYDTANADLMPKANIAVTATYGDILSSAAGHCVIDMVDAISDKNIKVVNTSSNALPIVNSGLGSLMIKKYKKVAAGAPTPILVTGGTTGQVLVKKSATNFDTEWKNQYPETCLLLTDISVLTARNSIALTNSYPQTIPIMKVSGGITLVNDIITLDGGYVYEFYLSLFITGSGYVVFRVFDTNNVSLMTNSQVAINATSAISISNASGVCVVDLTGLPSKNVRICNALLSGAANMGTPDGSVSIKKYKKVFV